MQLRTFVSDVLAQLDGLVEHGQAVEFELCVAPMPICGDNGKRVFVPCVTTCDNTSMVRFCVIFDEATQHTQEI